MTWTSSLLALAFGSALLGLLCLGAPFLAALVFPGRRAHDEPGEDRITPTLSSRTIPVAPRRKTP